MEEVFILLPLRVNELDVVLDPIGRANQVVARICMIGIWVLIFFV